MNLKLVNWEVELEQICSPVTEPLMIIGAPAGYGKTFLLHEVKRRYEQDNWKCALVDLEKVQGKSAIRNEITKQIGAHQIKIKDDWEADTALISYLADTGKVILLFDAEERANPDDSKWLRKELIPNAMAGLKGFPFRVIFVGRYIQAATELSKWGGYKRIELHPFSQAVVEKVIKDAVQQNPPTSRKLPNEYFVSWSKSIMRLTGGHPKCIQKLVTALEEGNWTLTVSSKTEEWLFQKYIKKEFEELTKSLDNTLRNSLEVLSIFRQFSLDTIRALQKKEIKDFPKDIEAFELLRKLTSIGLVARSKSRPFYSGDLVREFILVRMRIIERARYRELNRVAQEIYDAWIKSLLTTETTFGLGAPDLVPHYVQESIYHSFQQPSETIEQLAMHLRKQSSALTRALGEDSDDPDHRKLLENLMIADENIRSSLADRDLSVQILLDLAFGQDSKKPDPLEKIEDKTSNYHPELPFKEKTS